MIGAGCSINAVLQKHREKVIPLHFLLRLNSRQKSCEVDYNIHHFPFSLVEVINITGDRNIQEAS